MIRSLTETVVTPRPICLIRSVHGANETDLG